MMSGTLDAIGVYPICSTGAVLVHQIDHREERVLASINGDVPEWYGMTEGYAESTGALEQGFTLGQLFVPFCDVMRG